MKIRKYFVSNSSSSSYICDVCGHEESGWDLGLSDADMVECEHGHIFCVDHALTDEYEEDRYDVSESCCPICQLDTITNSDLVQFLLIKTGKSRKELEKELKENFKTHGELYNEEKIKVYRRKLEGLNDEE
jgi:hypothetical protein